MRLYSDRPDILVPGRWYRCPPTAQPVGWTAFFARRNNLEDRGEYPLGEVYQRHYAYSKKPLNTRLTGTRFCGDPRAWEGGIPFGTNALAVGQNGIPVCCGVPARSSLILGGSGQRVRVGIGSLVLSSPRPTTYASAGGVCMCETVGSTPI
jgi:hypothetical protein